MFWKELYITHSYPEYILFCFYFFKCSVSYCDDNNDDSRGCSEGGVNGGNLVISLNYGVQFKNRGGEESNS